MPSMDYSKWRKVDLDGSEGEDDDEQQPKEWSQMNAAEKEATRKSVEQEEAEAQKAKEAHDKYHQGIARDVQFQDASWMYDVDEESYEDFTIKRTWRVVKSRGTQFFKAGEYHKAEQQWLGGLALVQKVGMTWPTASDLYVHLKCNLAQLYIKTERWYEARQCASAALDVDPTCEKALYRRALVRMHQTQWNEAKRDLEKILTAYPKNVEAAKKLSEVKAAIKLEQTQRKGVGVTPVQAKEDLVPDGTLRKITVLVPGEDEPEDPTWTWPWGLSEWLGTSREKAVLCVHIVVTSVGGEVLFSTRNRMLLPESPEEQMAIRATMLEVAELDDKAGKAMRAPNDFYRHELCQPMRWRYGDPSVYSGFDLAARSMRLGEKAVFEIDQPMLEPSVCEFYQKDGGAARVAGLPNFRHHIEEQKLNLLAEELPEWELDLESKTQRTVRAELELMDINLFRDLSPGRTGEYLVRIADPGDPGGGRIRLGMRVCGDFVVAAALNGSALYHGQSVVWVLGEEGQLCYVDKPGHAPIYVPNIIGKVFQDARWQILHEGTHLEARLQAGPTPIELNPEKAKDFHWKRALGHRSPTAILIHIRKIMEDV